MATAQPSEWASLFETVAKTAVDGVFVARSGVDDPAIRIQFANEVMARISGYAAGELIGRSPDLFMGPETERDALARFRGARDPGVACVETLTLYRADRTTFRAEVSYSRQPGSDGSTWYVATMHDLTDVREAEEARNRTEAWAQDVIGGVNDVIIVVDTDATITWVSPSVEARLGHQVDDLLGTPVYQLLEPEDAARAAADFLGVLRGEGGSDASVFHVRHRDGSWRWMSVNASLLGHGDRGVVVSAADVTAQTRAEQRRHEQEGWAHALVQGISDVVTVVDRDGFTTFASPALSRVMGYEPSEWTGRRLTDLVHPADLADALRILTAGQEGSPASGRIRIRHQDGSWRTLSAVATGMEDVPSVNGTVLSLRDVTVEREMADLIAEQAEILEAIAQGASVTKVLEQVARLVEDRLPGALVSILRFDPRTQSLHDAAGRSIPAAFREAIDGVVIGPEVGSCGTAAYWRRPIVTADIRTDPRWVDFRSVALDNGLVSCWSVPVLGSDGAVLGTFAVYHHEPHVPTDDERRIAEDVARLAGIAIERTETRQRLVESEERFRIVAGATTDAIGDWDLVTDVHTWNEGFHTLFGYSLDDRDPEATSWSDHIHPDDREAVVGHMRAVIESDAVECEAEYRFLCKSGRAAYVLDRGHIIRDPDGRPTRLIRGMTDLTERHELAEQKLRSQRIESIGTLAGGIAHDLNNVLTPIVMAAALLADSDLPPDDIELVSTITLSAHRAAEMVKQVLTFARGVDGGRVPLDPGDLLAGVERIARDSFPKSIPIEMDVPDGSWEVLGDATQLHQVLLNLAVNARDAMGEGGTLRLSVTNIPIGAVPSAVKVDAPSAPLVRISVADGGTGMSAEVRARIFEPFFTTKAIGLGTGLGLSTSLSIVKSHGGFFDVRSTEGVGTTVDVYLPVALEHEPISVESLPAVEPGHGELVLVVDDEDQVLSMTRRTLEEQGYRVLTASNGAEAVTAYVGRTDPIDLVITDMMMPVLEGTAVIEALQAIDPTLPVIAVSGLVDVDAPLAVQSPGTDLFLAKPFSAESLLRAVGGALATRHRPARQG